MPWQDQLKGDSLSWLLKADSPGMRYLVLRDLLDVPAGLLELSQARKTAHQEGPIAEILSKMDISGFWVEPGPGYYPKYYSSVWSLVLLAQLGACIQEDERIQLACTYILDQALKRNGQFSASGSPSGTADCLQGNLCWALLELGCEDPRLEIAFEWMARTVTGEGMSSTVDRTAARRYYAGKCGPTFACGSNNRLPCAWGAVKVMLAFGKLPRTRWTPLIDRAVQHGVDFFFSIDPATTGYPCGFSNKPSQNWLKFGFPVFYVTDLLQIIEALIPLGYIHDPRLSSSISMIREKQDAEGRWLLDVDYSEKTWGEFGEKKQPSPWVTLRALRVLKSVGSYFEGQ
ncbi:MAG: nitrogen fixation protein NifH [Chloroflexi bacterium]|nr:nitrogen fixation protein NifH [Chloroflexota bacterium]